MSMLPDVMAELDHDIEEAKQVNKELEAERTELDKRVYSVDGQVYTIQRAMETKRERQ